MEQEGLRLHVAFNLVKLHCSDLEFQFNSFQCISVQLDNNPIVGPFSSTANPYVKTIAVSHVAVSSSFSRYARSARSDRSRSEFLLLPIIVGVNYLMKYTQTSKYWKC